MASAFVAACYSVRPSKGGGEIARPAPGRPVDPGDVLVPEGYRVEVVARGLTFPTGVTFAPDGAPVVVESGYSYGEAWTRPRLLRVERGGRLVEIAHGGRNGPWTAVDQKDGAYFVSEGGVLEGGRILRIEDGRTTVLVEGLPSKGDHHTNAAIAGPDGWVYFGQGVATNSGVVGEDNASFGWLRRDPTFHDIPCRDVKVTGQNFRTKNPLTADPDDTLETGPFQPFGTPVGIGQVIPGAVPCSGAIMRVPKEGGQVELVAWGFRNPFGLAFGPDGRLYATDNGYDDRGSRPIYGAADMLWLVDRGRWYGWPDYSEGRAIWKSRYEADDDRRPRAILAEHPGTPPAPLAYFAVHSSSNGLDFSTSQRFGHAGDVFVAQFGDQAPGVGKVLHAVGFRVVRVDPNTGVMDDFAVNRGALHGPASRLGTGGLERPVAVRFDPSGEALYVVDFGVLTMGKRGADPTPGTGVLWRITKEAP